MLRRSRALRALVVLASLALIALGLARMFQVQDVTRPEGSWEQIRALADREDLNVVFAMVDTLRADRLSTYGYERETSPLLDALAETGIVFENVLAQSTWTKTSMASLWTATYPSTNGVTRYPHGLPDAVEMPAERLRKAGFRTVGIWRNGWVAPNFGFGQGFELYYKPQVRTRGDLQQSNPSAFQLAGSDQDLTRAAQAFLESRPETPFFLYLHYMDVHQYVYDEIDNFGTSHSDIYDNSIRWVDKNLGTLWAVLQREGLMDDTLLVISSDHGEAFGEHGNEGHARDLYGETTLVPLVVALPFRLEEGIRVRTPVENVDIWPTIFDLIGQPPMKNVQGHSLVPLIEAAAQGAEGDGDPGERYAQLDLTWGRRNDAPKPLFSVGDGRYRLFHRQDQPDRDELYDVREDPREQHDIAASHPETIDSLMGRLQAYRDAPAPAWGSPDDVKLSDFELAQLRALGYVVGEDGEVAEEDDAEDGEDGETRSAGDGDGVSPAPSGAEPAAAEPGER